MKDNKIELIAVFKKEVLEQNAVSFLVDTGVKYRSGMDSSRGKLYFYKTGPKFILTFDSEEKRSEFSSKYESSSNMYELYIPNWRIQKD